MKIEYFNRLLSKLESHKRLGADSRIRLSKYEIEDLYYLWRHRAWNFYNEELPKYHRAARHQK